MEFSFFSFSFRAHCGQFSFRQPSLVVFTPLVVCPFFFFFFYFNPSHVSPLFAAVREGLLVTMIFAAAVIKFSDIFRFVMGENDAVIRSSAEACKL